MTNGTPPPKWPLEPTTLYVTTYYETNALDQNPTAYSFTLMTYNDAINKAKELITNANNLGVCIIQPISCTIVYPSVAWSDF